jgi:hypothetical protein
MSGRHRSILGMAVVAAALATAAPAGAAPPNDDFADALPLRVGQTVVGTTVGATAQRGEPVHGPGTSNSVWYRLRSDRKVSVLLNTCRAAGDSVIAIYTGRRVRSLTLIEFNDDGCSNLGSRVSFTARPGRTYRIAIAPFDEDEGGRFRLVASALNTPPNDDFVDAQQLALGSPIAGTSRRATLELREPTLGPHSVWFRLRVGQAGRITLRACFPGLRDPDTALAVYTGRRVARLRRVNWDSCSVSFAARAGVTYRIQVSHHDGGSRFRLTARASAG